MLRAAHGTLLMLPAAGAVLVVVLEGGLGPEQLWLPMEGAAARIQRHLRGMGSSVAQAGVGAAGARAAGEPMAALPGGGRPEPQVRSATDTPIPNDPERTAGT